MGRSAAPQGPELAKFTLPGFFFACSTISRRLFHGASAFTPMMGAL